MFRPTAFTLFSLLGALVATPAVATTADEIAELKKRIEQLEAQQNAQAQAPAPTQKVAAISIAPNTTFIYKGYVKADALMSRFSAGSVAGNNGGRDFYNPASTPVGNGKSSNVFDMHAKQTRFMFGTDTRLANGKSVITGIEFDFMAAIDGNERVSNGYEPELRHAFIQYDKWLAGQFWTNLMDLNALPETVDLLGPSEGVVFARQTQLRYSHGNLTLSLENPETTISVFDSGASQTTSDNRLPDVIARYNQPTSFGHVSIAGIARELSHVDGSEKTHELDFGLSLGSRINLGDKDNLKLTLTHGEGISRYVGLNLANDAVLDANNDLHTTTVTAAHISYQHFWADNLRSTLSVSAQEIDHPNSLINDTLTKRSQSALANIIWTPIKNMDVGAEMLAAKREVESGANGELQRLQFMAKYSF